MLVSACPRGSHYIINSIVDNINLLEASGLTTKNRLTFFLAQVSHESDGLRTTEEYASGKAYEFRKDLGNIYPGDGVKFKGRGLIQLTGRSNYERFGREVGIDLLKEPHLVETFPLALQSALSYWYKRNINKAADRGDFELTTRLINGGLNGYADRKRYLKIFKTSLEMYDEQLNLNTKS
ncbi:MAG: hypothetical protein C0446_08400 [Chitinophaga sp.]|nr:hypothetical protein [Chitinophaga sp.]